MKLTAVEVASLQPGDHRVGKPDDLILRVRPSGSRSWCLRYSYRGADRRFTIGRVKIKDGDRGLTLKQARDEALAILARVARGEDPQAEKIAERRAPPPPAAPTVGAICEEVLANLKVRPKVLDKYRRVIKARVLPTFENVEAVTVTRRHVRAWAETIAAAKPSMANSAFEIFRRIWNVAIDRDLVTTTPFLGLRKPARRPSRERVLSAGELWALLRALEQLPGTNADIVRLLLLTCVRRSNVVGATRAEMHDLDGRDPRWIIPGPRMKVGRQHVVPLSRQAVELVQRRLQGGSPLLFPAGQWPGAPLTKSPIKTWDGEYAGSLRRRVNKILGKLGPAEPWTIHDLRRTGATQMREALAVGRDVVALILAHAVPGGGSQTGIYDRAELLPARRAALQRLADWYEQLPEPGKVLAFRAGDGLGTE